MSENSKNLFIASLWFGLCAGIVEATAKTLPRFVAAWHTDSPFEILWIAPAFNLVLFLVLGAVLAALSRATRAVNIRLALALFIGTILFGVLFSLEIVGKLPSLILALGIGVQAGRSLLGREPAIVRFLGRSLPVLLVLALGLVVTGTAWPLWHESRLIDRVPLAKKTAPNIILITADTLRADHVSALGYSRRTTPFLDRLSKDSAVFEAAFTNSSWTLPSHASMFTGVLPNAHQADWRQPPLSRFPTLAQALAAEGYLTGAFTANREYVTPEWGLGRGFTHFDIFNDSVADYAVRTAYGKRFALNLLPRFGYFDIPGRKSASQLNREFLRWVDGSQKKPFFAFLNYMEVHDPYLTRDGFSTQFSNDPPKGDVINYQYGVTFRRKPHLSEAEVQREIDGYDGALAYLDSQLERLFHELETRRLLNNTIVIFTSDHGESFGNHGLFGHGNSLYRETLHVPLFFRWPGRIPALRVSQVVGLSQLPATVMDLVAQNRGSFPGESLTVLWSGQKTEPAGFPVYADLRPGRFQGGPDSYPNSRHGWSSLVTDEWHLLLSDDGRTELYAWRQDPDENHNLANEPLKRTLVQQLSQELRAVHTPSQAATRAAR